MWSRCTKTQKKPPIRLRKKSCPGPRVLMNATELMQILLLIFLNGWGSLIFSHCDFQWRPICDLDLRKQLRVVRSDTDLECRNSLPSHHLIKHGILSLVWNFMEYSVITTAATLAWRRGRTAGAADWTPPLRPPSETSSGAHTQPWRCTARCTPSGCTTVQFRRQVEQKCSNVFEWDFGSITYCTAAATTLEVAKPSKSQSLSAHYKPRLIYVL